MRSFFLLLLSTLPLHAQFFGIEPNAGQLPPEILFFQRASSGGLSFTRDSIRLFRGIEVQLANTSPQATPSLANPLSTTYNFYLGNNPAQWSTGVRQFRTVLLPNTYPGINASWASGSQILSGTQTNVGRERLTFNLAPGSNLSSIRIRFINAGDKPFEGPSGIWFTGGSVPGVFIASVEASQGNPDAPLAAALKIENSDTLSISAPALDPTRPAEFVVTFPNYQDYFSTPSNLPAKSSDGNRYRITYADDPSLTSSTSDALIARFSEDGTPLWVTLLGGSGVDSPSFFEPSSGGLVISGQSGSPNFPITTGAPYTALQAERTSFLAFLDRETGTLRASTFTPPTGNSGINIQRLDTNGDLIAGGSSEVPNAPIPYTLSGFLLRWRPTTNRFLYSLTFPDPVRALTPDSAGNLIYTTYSNTINPPRLTFGTLSASGTLIGKPTQPVLIPLYPNDPTPPQLNFVQLFPGSGQSLLAFATFRRSLSNNFRPLFSALGSFSLMDGTTRFLHTFINATQATSLSVTPSGDIKFVASVEPSPILPTSPNAPLVAPCKNFSEYYLRLSPTGTPLYSTYVPSGFNADLPEPTAPSSSLSCFSYTAGRNPSEFLAPGQLITLTGGNFGPASALYSAPDATGKFPTTFSGYRVRIGSFDAPIIAIARGLIAVQAPFELANANSPVSISISGPDAPANSISANLITRSISLFDTGDINNDSGYPALAALNQDGSVNSRTNPAAPGSIVSVFGSGFEFPLVPLTTGALHSTTTLLTPSVFTAGGYSTPVYFGSAPGLSNSLFQANLRLPTSFEGTGTRPLPISFAVSESIRNLFLPPASAIVWVKDAP